MKHFFSEKELAEHLSVCVSTLRKWRVLGEGPRFRKLGRAVRYAAADVTAFIEGCASGGQKREGVHAA